MPIRLDERLYAVASLVRGGSAADIGCDHGKLAYFLVSTDRAEFVIATDISPSSLKKAEDLAKENGAEDRMFTRLGDGLAPIANREVDAIVVAGLGGDVISDMLLDAYEEGKRFGAYVLSPNTHAEKVRRALSRIGQKIEFDKQVECRGKRYPVISSREGEGRLNELQEAFGAFYAEDESFAERAREELKYIEELTEGGASSEKLAKRAQMLKSALENIKSKG